jgi:serine protease Do
MRHPLWLAVLLSTPALAGSPEGALKAAGPFCAGEYADDLTALAPHVREYERSPENPSSSFCLRTTAVYECISYGSDGSIRRTKRKAVSHGTGFAFRRQGTETLLLTNQHVAEWPAVTDERNRVEDVPNGCKRVSESLRIVENEDDSYEQDDVALTRMMSDPQLDVAVLKARATLPVMPWKVGKSSMLRERNVVDVQGFPLGAFRATNVGKVISAYHRDTDREWDHDDFVVDALLSSGNSGSPVLAVSCKTGEFELVGIYHAGYSRGSALNVVIGIDQVRDLLNGQRRTPRPKEEVKPLAGVDREKLLETVQTHVEPYFPFGSHAAVVRSRADGALIFTIFSREFPLRAHPLVMLEDLPPEVPETFGELGQVWFGNGHGLQAYARGDLDAETQAQLARLLDALRRDAMGTFEFRTAAKDALSSRARHEQVSRLERALKRTVESRKELAQSASEAAERLGPEDPSRAISPADAYAVQVQNPAFPMNRGTAQMSAPAPEEPAVTR